MINFQADPPTITELVQLVGWLIVLPMLFKLYRDCNKTLSKKEQEKKDKLDC